MTFSLVKLLVEFTLLLLYSAFRWRTVRVFISSTFRDFHGERDLLARCVFPRLRSFARALCLDLCEIDLRWGIPEHLAYTPEYVYIRARIKAIIICTIIYAIISIYAYLSNPNHCAQCD